MEQVYTAVIQLKDLGFPLINIRQALPKLTGIDQKQIAKAIRHVLVILYLSPVFITLLLFVCALSNVTAKIFAAQIQTNMRCGKSFFQRGKSEDSFER